MKEERVEGKEESNERDRTRGQRRKKLRRKKLRKEKVRRRYVRKTRNEAIMEENNELREWIRMRGS